MHGANKRMDNKTTTPTLPPGTMQTLHRDDERFVAAYRAEFEGYHSLGDAGTIDEDGFISVMARTDDVINVAGHRLSTGRLEEVVASHDAVAECAKHRW